MTNTTGIDLDDLGVDKSELVTAEDREKLQKLFGKVRLSAAKVVVGREIEDAEAIFGIMITVINNLKGVSVADAVAMLGGQSTERQPREVGSAGDQPTGTTRTRRSGDEDRDLADKLARAEAAKRDADTAKQTAERELTKVLNAIGQALGGVDIPVDSDGKVKSDIKDMITTDLDQAYRQGYDMAIGEGNVSKTEAKSAVDKIRTGWATKRKPKAGTAEIVIDLPQRVQDIDDGVAALEQLLS